jgi:vancomycin resistance protein YoaR
VVGYYGPGLDATIYGPHPDLRFLNDTENYLLLQSKVEGDELIFEIYGQKDGRIAKVSEPTIFNRIAPPPPKYIPTNELPLGQEQCTETARYGMSTEATYMVEYPDGTVREQVFNSTYRPWRKVCLIGVAS